ncbi:MAG TPA: PP2C family serine/threonine-protein phosphatase [Gammaproteobacteria bacterium]
MAITPKVKAISANDAKLHEVIYANVSMDSAGEMFSIGAGKVVVYARRSPQKQSENEDSAGAFSLGEHDCALVIADGVGGMPCGAQASRIVIESLQESFAKASASEFGYREPMLNGIEEASQRVIALGVGAGSTVAAVEICNNVLRPYHAGDSMIIVVGQKGKIKQQTISHSPVGYAVEAGLLDADEALHHDNRHEISNFVGFQEMRIEIGPAIELARYDTVLIASDGLFDNLQLTEIIGIIRKNPLRKVSQQLASLCGNRMQHAEPGYPSKPDDVAFVLFRRGG